MNTFKDAFTLLRLPFSLLLMPVFLFAVSQCNHPNWWNVFLLFIILHLLVYPSSNAYNSYIDQDEGSIGGLKNPPKAGKPVYYLSLCMDVSAVVISLLINYKVALLIAGYILASRAYSSRMTRLKKYAIVSYLVVVVFQGGYIFILTQLAADNLRMITNSFAIYASSFLIGGIYPLTQVYQHEADRKSGDHTISLRLGVKGTFTLSTVMFSIAGVLMLMHFYNTGHLFHFYLYLLFLAPTAAFFMWWRKHAVKHHELANFKNTMIMNVLAAVSMNCFFLLLIYLNLV